MTLQGAGGLALARRAIAQVLREAGCTITFDPGSEPDLVDYLTVTTVSSIEGATLGAGLGALLGLLFQRATLGAALGAGIGLFAGANRGFRRVETGWRVQAVRMSDGTPFITLNALKVT